MIGDGITGGLIQRPGKIEMNMLRNIIDSLAVQTSQMIVRGNDSIKPFQFSTYFNFLDFSKL